MILNDKNFKIYAMSAYQNPLCLNEDEFMDDLNKITVMRKMITYHDKEVKINIRLLVNHFVMFYNVFDYQKASNLLGFKLTDIQKDYANSILKYLNFPLISGHSINIVLYEKIIQEFEV